MTKTIPKGIILGFALLLSCAVMISPASVDVKVLDSEPGNEPLGGDLETWEEDPIEIPIAVPRPGQTIRIGEEVTVDGSISTASYTGENWQIDIIDEDALTFETRLASIVLDEYEYPHTAYLGNYEWNDTRLHYAKWDGKKWAIDTVDKQMSLDNPFLALDSNGLPHIAYMSHFELMYARWNGTAWNIEQVDKNYTTPLELSMVLDSNDYPHISYRTNAEGDLRYAVWNGTAWNIEVVDTEGFTGLFNSLALDSSGNPHIGYVESRGWDVKYAKWNGNNWSIETVDEDGWVGRYMSMVLDSQDRPHFSYEDINAGTLKYATWTGSNWSIEVVDSPGGVSTSIAVDSQNHPHIAHFSHFGYVQLRYATWNGTAWELETVDPETATYYTAITIDSADKPHIAYGSNTPMYARKVAYLPRIISYKWDFTSDGVYDYMETVEYAPDGSFDGITEFKYDEGGVYAVTVRVTTESGTVYTDTCIITVLDAFQVFNLRFRALPVLRT